MRKTTNSRGLEFGENGWHVNAGESSRRRPDLLRRARNDRIHRNAGRRLPANCVEKLGQVSRCRASNSRERDSAKFSARSRISCHLCENKVALAARSIRTIEFFRIGGRSFVCSRRRMRGTRQRGFSRLHPESGAAASTPRSCFALRVQHVTHPAGRDICQHFDDPAGVCSRFGNLSTARVHNTLIRMSTGSCSLTPPTEQSAT